MEQPQHLLTVDHMLAMFGRRLASARQAYLRFITERPSETIVELLRNGSPVDECLLGSDEWVQSVLNDYDAVDRRWDLDEIVHDACQRHDVTEAILASRSRSRRHSRIRAEIALDATENGCATITEVARRFGRAHSGLSRAMNRLKDENQ